MRLAIVHEWLAKRGGAERVLEVFCEIFPQASVFATLYWPPAFNGSLLSRIPIRTSPIQRLPRSHKLYRN